MVVFSLPQRNRCYIAQGRQGKHIDGHGPEFTGQGFGQYLVDACCLSICGPLYCTLIMAPDFIS